MNTKSRYARAPVLATAISVAAWIAIASIHPIFTRLALSGLVPVIVAGCAGGFVAALVVPRHKVMIASIIGASLALILISRFPNRGTRELWLWYWPLWLAPTYAIGGVLGRRLWAT
jgi:hypothetical protein